MSNVHELIESAAPVPMPVKDVAEYFGSVVDYIGDRNPTIKMLYEAFGPEGTAKFISLFNGLTVVVPSKVFWASVLRDVHIYHSLRSRKMSETEREQVVGELSKTYKLPPKSIVSTYKKVKDAIA